MTHVSELLPRVARSMAVRPGRLAWLAAAGREQRQAAVGRAAKPVRMAPAADSASATSTPRCAEATAPRPAQRVGSEARYVRRWLAPRLPDLCEAVLRSALDGDMEATRLLLRMGGLDGKSEPERKKRTKTGPGFAKKALDEFRSR